MKFIVTEIITSIVDSKILEKCYGYTNEEIKNLPDSKLQHIFSTIPIVLTEVADDYDFTTSVQRYKGE